MKYVILKSSEDLEKVIYDNNDSFYAYTDTNTYNYLIKTYKFIDNNEIRIEYCTSLIMPGELFIRLSNSKIIIESSIRSKYDDINFTLIYNGN